MAAGIGQGVVVRRPRIHRLHVVSMFGYSDFISQRFVLILFNETGSVMVEGQTSVI